LVVAVLGTGLGGYKKEYVNGVTLYYNYGKQNNDDKIIIHNTTHKAFGYH